MPWGKVFFNSWCKGMAPSRTSWVICWERRGPDPPDPGQVAAGDQFRNGPILGLDDPGPLGVGPDFERVLPGQFQQLGDFSQDLGNFLVFHNKPTCPERAPRSSLKGYFETKMNVEH